MYQEYMNQLVRTIEPLDTDELKDLLNDDDKLDEKVDEVLQIIRGHKNSLFEENRQKAELNIEKEPQIIELRSKVNELSAEGRTKCAIVQEQLAKLKEKSSNITEETALALLQTAAAESEEQTEALIQKFTDNEIGVEAFLDEFLTSRKTMHMRKIKAEKMQEILHQQARGGGTRIGGNSNGGGGGGRYGMGGGMKSNFFPLFPSPSGGSGVPYPTGPMMPMPPRPY